MKNKLNYPIKYAIQELKINKGYSTIVINKALTILKGLRYNKAYLWTDQSPIFYEK